jgi:hypothetical protein
MGRIDGLRGGDEEVKDFVDKRIDVMERWPGEGCRA